MERDRLTNCRWVREPDALSERPERWRDCATCWGQRIIAVMDHESPSGYSAVWCWDCGGAGKRLA